MEMKLTIGEHTFELLKVPTSQFAVSRKEPYPFFEHRVVREDVIKQVEREVPLNQFKTYIYNSIYINGESYGFRLDGEEF